MLHCSRWKCGILACCGRVQLVQFWNTKDVNVGQSPISITIDPNLGTPNAKLFTGESSRKSVNFFTLITLATNGTHVAVLLESIRAISEQFDNMTYGFFLVKRVTYPIVANYVRNTWDSMLENGPWFRSSYDRAMIELQADVELKDTIVVAMPKLNEYPKNIGSDVAKNLKKPSQAPRGVLHNANTSGNKRKDVEFQKEVSNPNSFDVFNLVENDVNLGTNRETSNLASKDANYSGSLLWNVGSSSISTTHIVDKIDKIGKLIIDGKITLMDDEGKPVEQVAYPGDHNVEDEVEPVDNEMASFLA
ncbi:hypothetical protein Tco_1031860 [Tanacetum coccineum]|uniref:Uncharacterized protein n=1 Tax=Tanacetum coccineum TaxID=301880 RepID=A0ABQ5GBX1_9ASTR